jgi:hypothetical protein
MGNNVPEKLLYCVWFTHEKATKAFSAGALAQRTRLESYLGDTRAEGSEHQHVHVFAFVFLFELEK